MKWITCIGLTAVTIGLTLSTAEAQIGNSAGGWTVSGTNPVKVHFAGKLVTTYNPGLEEGKPFFYPLYFTTFSLPCPRRVRYFRRKMLAQNYEVHWFLSLCKKIKRSGNYSWRKWPKTTFSAFYDIFRGMPKACQIFPGQTALAARVQAQEHRIYPMVAKWLVDERLIMKDGKAYLDGAELGAHGYASDE